MFTTYEKALSMRIVRTVHKIRLFPGSAVVDIIKDLQNIKGDVKISEIEEDGDGCTLCFLEEKPDE